MRKILLGTTAVVGAALLAPAVAVAQEAPTVRIGGFFRAYYGNTQQSGRNSTQVTAPATPGSPATVGSTLPTNTAGATGNLPADSTGQVARLSKNDFSTDAEVHVFVNGKTANGLSYGAVIEIAFNQQEGRNIVQQRASTSKSTASIDEYYAFVASPTFGQLRFGDEDGPAGGLMNSGVVTNFGSGGVYGDRESFVTRQGNVRTTRPRARSATTPRSSTSRRSSSASTSARASRQLQRRRRHRLLDNHSSGYCDSSYAFTGASNFGVAAAGPNRPFVATSTRPRCRWRGSRPASAWPSPVPISVPARPASSPRGTQARVFSNPKVFQVGLRPGPMASRSVAVQFGDSNFFWGNTFRGDRPMEQFFGRRRTPSDRSPSVVTTNRHSSRAPAGPPSRCHRRQRDRSGPAAMSRAAR